MMSTPELEFGNVSKKCYEGMVQICSSRNQTSIFVQVEKLFTALNSTSQKQSLVRKLILLKQERRLVDSDAALTFDYP